MEYRNEISQSGPEYKIFLAKEIRREEECVGKFEVVPI